jgi:hypothetical protein
MSDGNEPADQRDDAHVAWQRRLLPFMVRMLVGLTTFFFIATLGQLLYLNARILNSPSLKHKELLGDTPGAVTAAPVADIATQPEERRLRVLARLEANVVARRYHQAGVSLMSAIWSKYLGFMTGMTLALVGATFVLGQLRTPTSDFGAKGAPFEVNLRSSSPGLVLAVLGVLLMATTIVTQSTVNSTDSPTYLGEGVVTAVGGRPDLPDLEPTQPDSAEQPDQWVPTEGSQP